MRFALTCQPGLLQNVGKGLPYACQSHEPGADCNYPLDDLLFAQQNV